MEKGRSAEIQTRGEEEQKTPLKDRNGDLDALDGGISDPFSDLDTLDERSEPPNEWADDDSDAHAPEAENLAEQDIL